MRGRGRAKSRKGNNFSGDWLVRGFGKELA